MDYGKGERRIPGCYGQRMTAHTVPTAKPFSPTVIARLARLFSSPVQLSRDARVSESFP